MFKKFFKTPPDFFSLSNLNFQRIFQSNSKVIKNSKKSLLTKFSANFIALFFTLQLNAFLNFWAAGAP